MTIALPRRADRDAVVALDVVAVAAVVARDEHRVGVAGTACQDRGGARPAPRPAGRAARWPRSRQCEAVDLGDERPATRTA